MRYRKCDFNENNKTSYLVEVHSDSFYFRFNANFDLIRLIQYSSS